MENATGMGELQAGRQAGARRAESAETMLVWTVKVKQQAVSSSFHVCICLQEGVWWGTPWQ